MIDHYQRGQAAGPVAWPPPEVGPPIDPQPLGPRDLVAGHVWLVVMDRGGIFGAYHTEALACEVARSIHGVLVAVPVVEDYRTDEPVPETTIQTGVWP